MAYVVTAGDVRQRLQASVASSDGLAALVRRQLGRATEQSPADGKSQVPASECSRFPESDPSLQLGGLPQLPGAATCAVTGGIIGALTQAGVPEEEASRCAEGIRRGGTLVSARIPEPDQPRVEAILDQSSVNLQESSAARQKSGWTGFCRQSARKSK